MKYKTIFFENNSVNIINQVLLPHKIEIIKCKNYERVVKAIKKMEIRGAPAIGVATALGIALGVEKSKARNFEEIYFDFKKISETFAKSRPTARNLFWAIERMKKKLENVKNKRISEIKSELIKEAKKILKEDVEINKRIAKFGAGLIKNGDNILTHCNAGALATVDYGTAIGVIREAFYQGKKIKVFVDETRPLLQGARLTAWELMQEKIPFVLICDNMAGYFISKKEIDLIIVGADRIARNGDVANKIGTYSLAVLSKENKIPFYVAAPFSTIDFSIKSGEDIIIEERNEDEVKKFFGKEITPKNVKAKNPAFDVTPAKYITAIITERGVIKKLKNI